MPYNFNLISHAIGRGLHTREGGATIMSKQAQATQASTQAQAQARLNLAKTDAQFIEDFNTVLEDIRLAKVAKKDAKDAQDAYTGAKKGADGKQTEDFKRFMSPYRKDAKDAQAKATRHASRLLAYYGRNNNSFSLDGSDAIVDVESLLKNIGALDGDMVDVKKEKQVKAISVIMDAITGRTSVSVTRTASTNNVLKFGQVKVVEDNVIDTVLMLEYAFSSETCLKSVYTEDNALLVDTDDNGRKVYRNRSLKARKLVNTVKTPLK